MILSTQISNTEIDLFHRLLFCTEYALYPSLLFLLILWVARREPRSSIYTGVRRSTEIIARNWKELSTTFLASLFLFEFRLFTEGIPLDILERIHAVPVLLPRGVSFFSNILLIIFTLLYTLYVQINKIDKSETETKEMIHAVKLSLIPFTIAVNLWISTLIYDETEIRIILFVASIILGFLYFKNQGYTSYHWFLRANKLELERVNLDSQMKAIEYRIKSYNCLSFVGNNSEQNYKFGRAIECYDHCARVANHFGKVACENIKFIGLLLKTKKILQESNIEAIKLENFNSEILNDNLEALKDICKSE